jgi:putative MATE family efflux protein
MTSPPLWRAFLAFLGPMMLSNILQALSGTISNIYLGHMIGVGALAAVSAFFPVLFFFISFIIGIGAGASVLIGQAWGARNHEAIRAVAGTALALTLLIAVTIAVFGGAFAGPLLAALGTPDDILADAAAYARVMLIAMPVMFTFFIFTAMLRGVGDTTTPLIALAIATAIGLLATPALIAGFAGLPALGVAGAAWASTLSFAITVVLLALHLRRRHHPLAPSRMLLHHLRVDGAILGKVLRIGVATGLQVVVVSLAEIAVLSFVNAFGSDATAAYGAVNQIVSYVQFPAISIAITASIFGAQAIGAGKTERLGAIVRTGILLNLVITGGLIALAYVFSRTIIAFFITSATVIEVAQTLLHITLWSYVIFGAAAVLSAVMRASGTVLIPTSIAIVAIAVVEVPAAWLLSRKIGLDGIWIAYPLTFAVMLAMQATYYRLVWRRKPITRLI